MVAQPNYGLSTDTTLGGNSPSDIISPSEKAIKTYVDNHSGGGESVDQTYDPTSANAQSGIAIAGAYFIQNKAGELDPDGQYINMYGYAESGGYSGITIGKEAATYGGISIGRNAVQTSTGNGIAIGHGAYTDGTVLNIGFSESSTRVNYDLLDGTTGLIPDARLSSNIQRTLVSGTDIKTLNNASLLGSGNISIIGLPSQTSQSGKFLTTNGTAASWADVPTEIPTQTGNSGKFLTTNGTAVSWAAVDALPSQTSQSGKFLTTNGTTASWADVTKVTIRDWSVA